jgi:hypothetical protein
MNLGMDMCAGIATSEPRGEGKMKCFLEAFYNY